MPDVSPATTQCMQRRLIYHSLDMTGKNAMAETGAMHKSGCANLACLKSCMPTCNQTDGFCTVTGLKLKGLSPPKLWVLSGFAPLADAVKSQQNLHLDKQVKHSSNAAYSHISICSDEARTLIQKSLTSCRGLDCATQPESLANNCIEVCGVGDMARGTSK